MFLSCLQSELKSKHKILRNVRVKFRYSFFAINTVVDATSEKTFNASKNTSMNLIFWLMLALFTITSLQLIFFSTHFRKSFFRVLRLGSWESTEISYLCQALFECWTKLHGISHSQPEEFFLFHRLVFRISFPCLGKHHKDSKLGAIVSVIEKLFSRQLLLNCFKLIG